MVLQVIKTKFKTSKTLNPFQPLTGLDWDKIECRKEVLHDYHANIFT